MTSSYDLASPCWAPPYGNCGLPGVGKCIQRRPYDLAGHSLVSAAKCFTNLRRPHKSKVKNRRETLCLSAAARRLDQLCPFLGFFNLLTCALDHHGVGHIQLDLHASLSDALGGYGSESYGSNSLGSGENMSISAHVIDGHEPSKSPSKATRIWIPQVNQVNNPFWYVVSWCQFTFILSSLDFTHVPEVASLLHWSGLGVGHLLFDLEEHVW